MIHRPQNEYVHVAKVAGDEVRHDVALAIRQDFIAAGEPLQNQMDVIGSFALSDDVGARGNEAALAGGFGENPPVLAG